VDAGERFNAFVGEKAGLANKRPIGLQNLQNDLHNWRRWLCKQAANRHAKFAK
jgi:hypothetical protein